MAEHVARRAVVNGRVQGVFFRAHVQEAADRASVTGWARNCPQGGVEVHAEGPADGVAAVIEACRSGSERARVDAIDVWDVAVEGCVGFERR